MIPVEIKIKSSDGIVHQIPLRLCIISNKLKASPYKNVTYFLAVIISIYICLALISIA